MSRLKDRPTLALSEAEQAAVDEMVRLERRMVAADSYIYFIECEYGERPIKIGVSNNPESRLVNLQISSPWPLRIIHTFLGNMDTEQALHRQFADDLIRGEWFRPTRHVLRFILESKRTAALISCPDRTRDIDILARVDADTKEGVRRAIDDLHAFLGGARPDVPGGPVAVIRRDAA